MSNSINIYGNIASGVVFRDEYDEKKIILKSSVVCCESVWQLEQAVINHRIDDVNIIVLRLFFSFKQKDNISEVMKYLQETYPDKEYLVLSDIELPYMKNIYSLYIENKGGVDNSILYAIKDGDTISFNSKEGSLYLYVADSEIRSRQFENKRLNLHNRASEKRETVLSNNMQQLVVGSSVIRKLFEEGLELAEIVGPENVYDFSLGNPAAPVPQEVKSAIYKVLENNDSNYVHGYMKNAGYDKVRCKVAEFFNAHYNSEYSKEDIIMTVGAAGGINCIFRSLLNENDDVICFAPYFGEYRSYVKNYNGNLVVVPANFEDFQINIKELKKFLNPKVKAVIINNPNNPSGVIYREEVLMQLQSILEQAEKEFGHPIYVIADEPYRDLVYDNEKLPFVPKYIKNCIVVYSFSKSLSLSGERIGYMAVSKDIDYYDEIINALVVANRCMGYINAPSLFQLVIAECLEVKTDLEFYDRNRKLLYQSLSEMGFECVKPQGAFYMLVKSPVQDDKMFVQKAKEFNILLVPATSFGCPGYVRLAYCVSYDMIKRSLPAFKKLANVYFLN